MSAGLALFPLKTVLFPGGRLALKIFEPRYLELVKRSMRDDAGFGVVAISDDSAESSAAPFLTTGTIASIIDFSTLPDGLLGIVCRGGRRFELMRHSVESDGLNVGDVRLLEVDPVLPVPPEYGLLSSLLRRAVEEIDGLIDGVREADYDNAAWVGWRLGEVLPLDLADRQTLLETDDAIDRLALLARWLPRFQR